MEELSMDQILLGYTGRLIKGASLPEHNHINEQLMHVIEGEFEFTIDGKKNICSKGSTFLIPSNVPHSGRALSKCIIMDVFCPKREDLG